MKSLWAVALALLLTHCGPGFSLSPNNYYYGSYYGNYSTNYFINAGSFDGASSQIMITQGPTSLLATYSIEAFIQTNSVIAQAIFKWTFGGGPAVFGINSAGQLYAQFPTPSCAAAPITITTSFSVADGIRHHVAVEADAALQFLFVDGSLAYWNGNGMGSCTYTANTVGNDGIHFFKGTIDEIRVSSPGKYGGGNAFGRPSYPFIADSSTVLLMHFDGDLASGALDYATPNGTFTGNSVSSVVSPF